MIDFVISLSAIEGTIPMTPSRRSANERRADAIISTEMESLFSIYLQYVCVHTIIYFEIFYPTFLDFSLAHVKMA